MGNATFMFGAAQRLMLERAAGTTLGAPYMDLDTDANGDVVTNGSDRVRCMLLQHSLEASTHAKATNMGTGTGGLFNTSDFPTAIEITAGGYSPGGGAEGALKNGSWNAGTGPNVHQSFYYGTDINWGVLGTGTDIRCCVLYYGDGNKTGAATSHDVPIACYNFLATPDGNQLLMQWASVNGQSPPTDQGVILITLGVPGA